MASKATRRGFAALGMAAGGCRIIWEKRYHDDGPKTVRALLDRVEKAVNAALQSWTDPPDELNERECRAIERTMTEWWDEHAAENDREGEPIPFFSAFSLALLTELWIELERARPEKRERIRGHVDEVQKALAAWHQYFDRNEKHADAALRALDAAEKWSRMWS